MKYLIIGDVHGCYDQLMELLDKCREKEVDKYIFLGDYIDRGPKSKEVVSFIRDHFDDKRYVFLQGNHELMLSTYLKGLPYLCNGFEKTVASLAPDEKLVYGNVAELIYEYCSDFDVLVKQMPLFYEAPEFIACHGNLINENPKKEKPSDLLWSRSAVKEMRGSSRHLVISGHTPAFLALRNMNAGMLPDGVLSNDAFHISGSGVIRYLKPGERHKLPKAGTVVLDTGCYGTGNLSALYVDTEESKMECINTAENID